MWQAALSAPASGVSSAVVKAMKDEISRLQNELEITAAQKNAAEAAMEGTASGSGGVSSEQAARYVVRG